MRLVFQYDSQTKCQSLQQKNLVSPREKKCECHNQRQKSSMFFFDIKGIICYILVPLEQSTWHSTFNFWNIWSK